MRRLTRHALLQDSPHYKTQPPYKACPTPCLTLYKTNWLTYLIIKPLLSIDYFSLPNLIANKKILPELLQKDVTIKNIIHSINSIRQKSSEFYTQKFNQIQEDLKAGGADKASLEVLKLLN